MLWNATSAATDLTSPTIDVVNLDTASIHLVSTSTVLGSVYVDARNGDKDAWYELDFGPVVISSGEPVNQIVFKALPFTSIRLRYVRTSGTGNLSATITAKTDGA